MDECSNKWMNEWVNKEDFHKKKAGFEMMFGRGKRKYTTTQGSVN